MARRLKLVKGGAQKGALVYGMRIFDEAPSTPSMTRR